MGKPATKRIGIDARFYGPVGKGLGRYTQEIVDNIIRLDRPSGQQPGSGRRYVIFLSRENFDEFQADNPAVEKILAPVRWYSLAEQIRLPYLIWRARLDLIHFPHFNVPALCPVRFVVTIHDLILTRFPTVRASTLGPLKYKLKNWGYKMVIWLAVRRAKKVIAVSRFTKEDLVKQFKIKADKVVVTYEGVANLAKGRDSLFAAKLDDKKTLLGYNINSPFLLYVGNAYPHKNLEFLIEVFAKIKKQQPDLRLVLVGRQDYFYNRVKAFASGLKLWSSDNGQSPVVFPGYVPDAQLEILYQRAQVYVFPSLYEGFGLPPLEAMAKSCPVASSNQSCLPEVLGSAALYFNPNDQAEMKQQIERLISDQELRQELIKRGLEQVKKYNWWECARKTLEVYQEVL